MGRAAQTQARLIDQRARGRATQQLIERHKAEWDELYERHKATATVEVQALQEAAAAQAGQSASEHAHPVRLKPGRRQQGQTVLDRIAELCKDCAGYHERGHTCASCGAGPDAARSEPEPVSREHLDRSLAARAKAFYDNGSKVEAIAAHLHITPDHVERLLDGGF